MKLQVQSSLGRRTRQSHVWFFAGICVLVPLYNAEGHRRYSTVLSPPGDGLQSPNKDTIETQPSNGSQPRKDVTGELVCFHIVESQGLRLTRCTTSRAGRGRGRYMSGLDLVTTVLSSLHLKTISSPDEIARSFSGVRHLRARDIIT